MNVLQHFLFPGLHFAAPESMYVRARDGKSRCRLEERRIDFHAGGLASFDTFYNGLTIELWKRNCAVEDLNFTLEGSGAFRVRFGLHRTGNHDRWLHEARAELSVSGTWTVPCPFWAELETGMLFVELECIAAGEIVSASWATAMAPVTEVKLGIVITHYRRKQYVLPAAERIGESFLENPEFQNNVMLLIVDNSKEIRPEEVGKARVLPNENYGGSGGFARGLITLKDEGYSHCLFMDDDASCEMESIRRTYRLLQYAVSTDIAVAGSLLSETKPYHLMEKGAKFRGRGSVLKTGLDMRSWKHLLQAEVADSPVDYGGWWFFAFNIRQAKAFPFPFFVRGDDILFGLMNDFNIVTANGIACWGEEFSVKDSPLTRYLDTRHIVVQRIYQSYGAASSLFLLSKLFAVALFSYNYASARAVRMAMGHALEGGDFWVENIDMAEVRKQIGAFKPSEKMVPVDLREFETVEAVTHENPVRKAVRFLTLNGFLLPSMFFKKSTVLHEKGFKGRLRSIFRHPRVIYYYEAEGVGYIARHEKRRFFGESALFVVASLRFMRDYSSACRNYRAAIPEMTTETFWRGVYPQNDTGAKEQ